MAIDPVHNNELGRLLEELDDLGLGEGGPNRVQQVVRPVFEAIENYDEVVAQERGKSTLTLEEKTAWISAPFLIAVLGLGVAGAILIHPVLLVPMVIVGYLVVHFVFFSVDVYEPEFQEHGEARSVRVDARLNQANFKKPLLGPDVEELPHGTDKRLYEKLVDLCRIEMEGEGDRDALVQMMEEWKKRASTDLVIRKLLNHLVLFYERDQGVDRKCFFYRLNSQASRLCESGQIRELYSLYRFFKSRSLNGPEETLRLEELVQRLDGEFRAEIAEKLAGDGEPEDWHRYFYHVHKAIFLPGGETARKPYYSRFGPVYFQEAFFQQYTSQTLIRHFCQLFNDRKLNSEMVSDWLKSHVPADFEPNDSDRDIQYLQEALYDDDDPKGTYKMGEIKASTIERILVRCGILNTQ